MESRLLYGLIVITCIFLLLSVCIIYLAIFQNKRKLLFKQQMLLAQLEIQEQTLKNISQEIHDNIGQGLTLAKLNLNALLPGAGPLLYEKIFHSKELVSRAIADLRDLSRSFDTDYIMEMGLHRAIEYELELLQKTGSLTTYLKVEGMVVKLDKQKELILFRIVQETFTNIIKHAEAVSLAVSIGYEPQALQLRIKDDGKGMDLTSLKQGTNVNSGLGIRNMHSRAKLISADFSMSSMPGQGTEIRIALPIDNNHHEDKPEDKSSPDG